MFIYLKREGDVVKPGISFWGLDKHTLFAFIFLIPIWPILPKQYYDFDTDCCFYGWRFHMLRFYFRIRHWKLFKNNVRKVIYKINKNIRPIGKRKLIYTREMLEDAKCQ